MTPPRFSLVVPCYNEARSLPDLIRRCRFVAEEGEGEVILVDNGSTDDTPHVLCSLFEKESGARVRTIRVEVNRGYGFGITSGLAEATAPLIGWTHADLQTDPIDLLRGLSLITDFHQPFLLKGRRYGRPVSDRFFTAGMSMFETALFGRRMTDINSQPTLFPRELMEIWGTPPRDFSLDLFTMHAALLAGYEVVRFPVLVAPRRFGTSSWNVDFAAKRRFIKRTLDYSFTLRRALRSAPDEVSTR